jgi:hypothetical protein
MNSLARRKQFLSKHQDLFWHFDKTKLENLSLDIVVEYVLNYGDENSVRELLDVFGLEKVANIFSKNTAEGRRVNYFPEVQNFFTIYFNRHAFRSSK